MVISQETKLGNAELNIVLLRVMFAEQEIQTS